MSRPYQAINEIIKGTKQITPDTARELAGGFGTSIDFWMNLEANYRSPGSNEQGNTTRIISGDTLLENFSDDEIETVLAHELGHHVNKVIFRSGSWSRA